MDEDGNLLDQKDFEAKLDKAVVDGTIKAEDKDSYLRMYENCADGNGNGGMMGGRSGMMNGRGGMMSGRSRI